MSIDTAWKSLKEVLLEAPTMQKARPSVSSNLEDFFKQSSYESYVLELKKAMMIMDKACPAQITTPFKGNCLEITRCQQYYVFGSIEGRIAVIHRETREIIQDIPLEGGSIHAIAIYNDNSYVLAAGKDGVIKKFDFNTFNEVKTYHGHVKEINGLILSLDETFIFSASDDGTVRSWNESDSYSSVLYTHDKAVLCLNRSEDGTVLISGGSDKKVKLYDIDKKIITATLSEFSSSVWAVVISKNNKYFAAGDGNSIITVWDFNTKQVTNILTGHTKRVSHLEFNSSETLIISSSNDSTIRIWNLIEDKNEIILTGHTDWIKSFKITNDEKFIISIAENFKIMSWLFPKFDSSIRKKYHSLPITFMCYSRANNYIFTTDSKEIKVWDIPTKTIYKTLTCPYGITAMCINSDGAILIIAYTTKEIAYWNLEDISSEVRVKHTSTIKSILASPDGRYLVCGDTNFRVTIYNKKNFSIVNIFRKHNSEITALTFSKPIMSENDQFFSGGGDALIYMHSITTNKSFKFIGHTSPISFLAVSRNNELLISGEDTGCFKIWNIIKQSCIRSVTSHTKKITGIYFSENSKYFWISSRDSYMSLWNSTSFTEVTRLKTKYPISGFYTTKNEIELVLAENEDVYFFSNPLKTSQFFIYGPGTEYYSFMKYIVQIYEGGEQEHDPEMDKWIITPFEINALHFYAYFNLPGHLKRAMAKQSPFYFSKSNYSPLQIAISRNFRDCINVIIKSIRLKVQNDPYSVGYIEDSIFELNKLGFTGLDNFYNSIMFRAKDTRLPKFCDENVKLPILINSWTLGPQQKDFFPPSLVTNFGKPIRFWQSALKVDVVLGSKNSIEFLESIINSPNCDIFTTLFVKELILHKWKYIKWFLMPQALFYLLYIVILSIFMIFEEGNDSYMVVIILLINSLLSLYEVFQVILTSSMYLKDPWNYIDVLRASLCYIYCIIDLTNYNDKLSKKLLVALTFVSMLRGVSYFRLFDTTRYLIDLLSEVFKDMYSFILILSYSTYSFALIYFIMENNIIRYSPDIESDTLPFSDYIATAYLLNLGDFDTSDYGAFEWMIFFFASVINPLIMLNLLISIMGDTYSRVKEEQEIADMKELTQMVIEGEYLLFCKRKHGRKTYMQICKKEEVNNKETSVDYTLKKIKDLIKSFETKFESRFKESKKDLKESIGAVNNKLDEITTLIEQVNLVQD